MATFVKWGVIASIALTVGFSAHFGTLEPSNPSSPIYLYISIASYFIAVAGGIWSVKKERADEGIKFVDGLKIGMRIVLIASIVTSTYLFFYFNYINEEILEKMIIANKELIMKGSDGTGKEVAAQIKNMEQSFTPFRQMNVNMLMLVFLGILFSIISSVIFKKR